MTVERLSVSLPPDLAADIREAAEAAGWTVSVWIMSAAKDRLVRDRAQGTRERELEFWEMVGPIPEEYYREADEFIDRFERAAREQEERDRAEHGHAA